MSVMERIRHAKRQPATRTGMPRLSPAQLIDQALDRADGGLQKPRTAMAPKLTFSPAPVAVTGPQPALGEGMRGDAGVPRWQPPAQQVMQDTLDGLRNLDAPKGAHPFDAPLPEALLLFGARCAAAGSRAQALRADKSGLPVFRGVVRHRGWHGVLPYAAAPAPRLSDGRWDDALTAIAAATEAARAGIDADAAEFDSAEVCRRRPVAALRRAA